MFSNRLNGLGFFGEKQAESLQDMFAVVLLAPFPWIGPFGQSSSTESNADSTSAPGHRVMTIIKMTFPGSQSFILNLLCLHNALLIANVLMLRIIF